MLTVYSLLLGKEFQSNCYVAENENKEAFAVDIGGDPDELLKFIKQNGLTLKKILLTHGHYDHFRGVAAVAENTGAEVFIHMEDEKMLTNAKESLAPFIGAKDFEPVSTYTLLNDGDIIDFSGTQIKVIHTPGHTRGGVCYVCEDKIFSGDTLFNMSIGRTDFPGGDHSTLLRSLGKIAALSGEKDYEIYPGHDRKTTLSYEMRHNPYMR